MSRSIEEYINRTRTDSSASGSESRSEETFSQQRRKLTEALDQDDENKAARIVYQLLEAGCRDPDLEILQDVLKSRVGVRDREPFFRFSSVPTVRFTSAIMLLIPLCLLMAELLEPTGESDKFFLFLVTLILATPLIDVAIADTYNYLNRHRRIE